MVPVPPAMPTDIETPLPTRVAGEYELLRVLGRGGMGIVYLARQCGLKRKVAYKVLTQLGRVDPDSLERFRGEAETLAKLQHSGIVQVFDSGTSEGAPFLAMEYVSGGSLAEKLRDGRMDPRAAATIIATVAAALGHAHAHGIIHRDLKPANILLTADGQPKVADFGLARDLASEHLTQTGFIAGTPSYMAPEQLTGQRNLSPSVDVWSLGVMLYEMLARTVPFAGGDPPQILANILRHDPISPRHWQPQMPRDLETICLKCLQKEPHRRYPSGTELADDLLRFLDGQPILARPVGKLEKGLRWCRQNTLASGLLATTAVILFAATTISLALAGRAREQRDLAEAHAFQAIRSRAAEAQLRVEAERAAANEKVSRERAERAAENEKQARADTERMTALLDSLLAGIRSGPNPLNDLLKQMDEKAKELETMQGDPLIRARILLTLGITRRNLGRFEEAIPLVEQAYELRQRHLGLADELTRSTAIDLSYSYYHVHRHDDAIRALLPVIEAETARSGPESEVVMGRLGLLQMIYASAGRLEDEAKLGDRILDWNVRKHGPDSVPTEWTRVKLRRYQVATGNFRESIPILRKAYLCFLEHCGPNDFHTQWTRVTLGLSLLRNNQPREALPYLYRNYHSAMLDNTLEHGHSMYAAQFLAECYEACDRPAEAIPIRTDMLDAYRKRGDARGTAEMEKILNRIVRSAASQKRGAGP